MRARPGQGREYPLPSGRVGIQIQVGGKRYHVTGKNATEARRKRDDLVAQHRAGLLGSPEARRTTLGAHLAAWLEGKRPAVVASTWARYRVCVEVHLVPALGPTRLPDLSPAAIRKVYGQLTRRGLSAVSVRHVHVTLHQALKQAVADGLLARNPATGLPLPKIERAEVVALTGGEVARLLAAADGDWRALWTLAAYTGLREGELLGLLWRDVDLDAGTLTVQRVLADGPDGRPALRPYPKRHASVRTVPLAPEAVARLREHQTAQKIEKVAARAWADRAGAVFLSKGGSPLLRTNVVRTLRRDAAAAGLGGRITVHTLRHSYASHLLAQGRPITEVAYMLGHSSPGVTLRVYAHFIKTDGRAAAEAIARAYQMG